MWHHLKRCYIYVIGRRSVFLLPLLLLSGVVGHMYMSFYISETPDYKSNPEESFSHGEERMLNFIITG